MSDKNLYLNEFANEKSFFDLIREQKDKDDAIKSVKDLHDMKAADRVRKSHDTKSSIAKYTSLFRMNLKTIRTEGRIGKKGPQTAHFNRKSIPTRSTSHS